ncbi:MAG: type I restriction enzyme HsdR N-terminal domain-containing protein [Chlamydiales bacterium]|nr:type I restriction enzyme HsdR N-terminal domain-containing protein [Chlamydiales bacterium]
MNPFDSKSLFDPIRQERVAATPEEIVRQKLIHHLVNELFFPKELIAVEKAIATLAYLTLEERRSAPKRRIDLLCFAKNIHPNHNVYPLLLVECKAIALNVTMKRQLIGYNYYVKAPYVLLAGSSELFFGWYEIEKKGYVWIDYIPSFQALCSSLLGA